jgi:hypothetical protein
MKIQILVRSPDWLDSAGVRIRYRRLQSEFSRLGCALAIDAMSGIREGLKLNADVYIFSKCQDAGALMLANMLREAGALVGFDLFDDYVSGTASTTFAQREFQRALRHEVDFLLCSTPQMASVAKSMDRTIPIHILNDPLAHGTRDKLAQLLKTKVDNFRKTGRINVLWFGNGNNPLFPVGITDLVAFSDALVPIAPNIHLKVLTNADALDVDGLRQLRNLPFSTEIEEWSAAAENASLDEALLTFLPVNYQSFSIAKSLNRAITALTHGAQVLTAGYPLYSALEDFIYDSSADFMADLQENSPKLRGETLSELDTTLAKLADPALEASRLLTFLTGLPTGSAKLPVEKRPLRAIVHGAASTPAVHTLGRALGWLSLASPMSRQSLPFDAKIGFFDDSPTPELRLTRKALARISEHWRHRAMPVSGKVEPGDYSHILPLPDTAAASPLTSLSRQTLESKAGRMVHYDAVMAATETVLQDVFGDMLMMRSEMEMPLPGMRG